MPKSVQKASTIRERYLLIGSLGAGGMGEVFLAEDLELGRRVALKVLRAEPTPRLLERFRREARTTSQIEHENVVDILDVGATEDGRVFFVMEALKGENLQSALYREQRLPWPRVQRIALQVCRALAAAHARGVIHRDLKPANIFRAPRAGNPDFIKILDFGIAKTIHETEPGSTSLTRTGEVIGTIPYMAPEQAAGEDVDRRIDIYALGVIIFELLTGRLPFDGKSAREVLANILTRRPPLLCDVARDIDVPLHLDAILQRCMHRDTAQRYPTMLELHDDLARLAPVGDEIPMAAQLAVAAESVTRPDGLARVEPDGEPPPAQQPLAPAPPLVPPPLQAQVAPAEPQERRARPARSRRVALGVMALLVAFVGWMRLNNPNDAVSPDMPAPEPMRRPEPSPPAQTAVLPPSPAFVENADPPGGAQPAPSHAPAPTPPPAVQPERAPPDPPVRRSKRTPSSAPPVSSIPTRRSFEEVLQRATSATRRCLMREGLMEGDSISFDVRVAAGTGKIVAAEPRGLHRERSSFGACLVVASANDAIAPAPESDLTRPYEVGL